jgi:hypothetical protein
MPTYKNLSTQKLVIPGVGEVEPGETIESKDELRNYNLEEVSTNAAPQQPATPAQPTQPKPATPQPTPKIGGNQ